MPVWGSVWDWRGGPQGLDKEGGASFPFLSDGKGDTPPTLFYRLGARAPPERHSWPPNRGRARRHSGPTAACRPSECDL